MSLNKSSPIILLTLLQREANYHHPKCNRCDGCDGGGKVLKLKLSKYVVWVGLSLPMTQAAFAANQCLALPGTYGAVTVTGCDNDTVKGITNPMSSVLLPGFYPDGFDGVGLGNMPDISMTSCTYTFNHPILASSITVDLTSMEPSWGNPVRDAFSVSLDGTAYAFTSADIVQTPLLPVSTAFGPGHLDQEGGTVISAPDLSSSGKVKISASQWINSMKVTMKGSGVARVCLDDAAPPTPPSTVAASVPLGPWAGGAASVGILGLAAFMARRRKGVKQS
ncbi:hypothetical protein [Comamonas sp. 4034]|uniref:hypothetical protein n=1 Tax=Comamonas sp. 4034 TaxID=3156455 RepID=UPI003D22E129